MVLPPDLVVERDQAPSTVLDPRIVADVVSKGLRTQFLDDRKRKVTARRQGARAQVRQFLDDVQFEVTDQLTSLLRDVQRDLRDEFTERLGELQRTYTDAAKRAQEDAQRSQTDRNERLAHRHRSTLIVMFDRLDPHVTSVPPKAR